LKKKSIYNGTESIDFISTLQIVDLAGSESIGKTLSNKESQSEGKEINKSLLTLGRIIVLLSTKKNDNSF